ncbi:hypothetical protein [Aeromonas hydrophila]|uniref:hypothetical protein n=1 Tax=Aeromonas hydrophila TaxID=644 RepID=UPI003EC8943B
MDIWQRLGIQETDDLAAIKRAYHLKLRDCHPEDDPEGFRLLREAYEAASRPRPAMHDAAEQAGGLARPAEAPELAGAAGAARGRQAALCRQRVGSLAGVIAAALAAAAEPTLGRSA